MRWETTLLAAHARTRTSSRKGQVNTGANILGSLFKIGRHQAKEMHF